MESSRKTHWVCSGELILMLQQATIMDYLFNLLVCGPLRYSEFQTNDYIVDYNLQWFSIFQLNQIFLKSLALSKGINNSTYQHLQSSYNNT